MWLKKVIDEGYDNDVQYKVDLNDLYIALSDKAAEGTEGQKVLQLFKYTKGSQGTFDKEMEDSPFYIPLDQFYTKFVVQDSYIDRTITNLTNTRTSQTSTIESLTKTIENYKERDKARAELITQLKDILVHPNMNNLKEIIAAIEKLQD